MKLVKKAAAGSFACIVAMSISFQAFAVSPEFARTAEEWASLQDDRLEYDELADLIHEYNTTVQNNEYEYNKFVRDYGRTKTDISQAYLDLANDLESGLSGGDSASERISDMQLKLQAKQLREQADDNVEDSKIYRLTYNQAEDNLVLSAQSGFLSYYKKQLELESAKAQKTTYQRAVTLAQTQSQAGVGTQIEVLEAQETVLNQETTIANLEMEIEAARKRLITMLGWKEGDQPEIGRIPQVSMEAVDAIDVEADKQKAVENNYTMNINKQKLENAETADKKGTLENQIENNQRQIAVSVNSAYQTIQAAKLSYEQAAADLQTTERNVSLAAQKLSAGMITSYEYEEQQDALFQKQKTVKTASITLMEAWETYQWNVNGLAAAE